MGLLISTAFSAGEVANALGVNESRVRQRRIAKTLWAIDDNGAWVFQRCSSSPTRRRVGTNTSVGWTGCSPYCHPTCTPWR